MYVRFVVRNVLHVFVVVFVAEILRRMFIRTMLLLLFAAFSAKDD